MKDAKCRILGTMQGLLALLGPIMMYCPPESRWPFDVNKCSLSGEIGIWVVVGIEELGAQCRDTDDAIFKESPSMQRRQIGKGPHKRFSGLLLESLEDRHLPSGVANLIVQPPAAADSRSSTPPVASPTAQAAPSSSGASQTSASAQNQSNSYFPTTQPPDSTPWTASASSAAQNPSASSSATSQQNQGPYAPGSGTTNPASTMSNPGNGRSTPTYNDPTPTDTNGN